MKKTILTSVVISFSAMGLLAQLNTSANKQRKQIGQFEWKPVVQGSINWNYMIIDDYIRVFVPDNNNPFSIHASYEDYGNVTPIPQDSATIEEEPVMDEFMPFRQRNLQPVLNDVIDVEHQIK